MIFGRKARHRADAPAAPMTPAPPEPVVPPTATVATDPVPPAGVAPTAATAAAPAPAAVSAPAAPPPSGPVEAPVIVDLRILLLTSGDDEPSLQAWQARLESEGVPFDRVTAGITRLTTDTLEHHRRHGRYQAVVLATDALVRLRDEVYESSLDPDEWATLRDYLRRYRVRQISAYATPGPAVGLQPASWAGDVGDTVAHLTDAGRAVFPDLVADVPLSAGTYGFRTAVADPTAFTALVVDRENSPVVGVVAYPDGREELVVTVASGPFSRHMHLLGHGLLAWATRGRHLGHHGRFLSMQIDDILLGANVALGADPIRMGPADVDAAARWSADQGVRLDFAYNGWGAVAAIMDRSADALTERLISSAAAFNWVNHTFGHLDLDHATAQQIDDEIVQNLTWARENGVDVPADTLVTGAHSGLLNPALAEVADRRGVRWIASDASRTPRVQPLGDARLVPRHPVNIPLDVCTEEALRQRHATGGAGTDTLERTPVLAMEATLILTHLLSNDPRPHYSHQNTLVGDRLLLGLLDGVLQSCRALIRTAPVQLSLAEAGQELVRRATWAELVDRGTVTARAVGGVVEVVNDADRPVEIPWSGPQGSSGWVTVPAADRLVLT